MNANSAALQDEHVLDFGREDVRIPAWFKKDKGLKVLFASGDWISLGMPNTEMFRDYDIHTCYPYGKEVPYEPPEGEGLNIAANVEYIRTHLKHQRLICILNIADRAQVGRFINCFRGSVSTIATLDPRVFTIDCWHSARIASELLEDTGTIVAIHRLGDAAPYCDAAYTRAGLQRNTTSQVYRKTIRRRTSSGKKRKSSSNTRRRRRTA